MVSIKILKFELFFLNLKTNYFIIKFILNFNSTGNAGLTPGKHRSLRLQTLLVYFFSRKIFFTVYFMQPNWHTGFAGTLWSHKSLAQVLGRLQQAHGKL
ncbi:hypothetical protein ACJX0J_018665, partial [Zea mays]